MSSWDSTVISEHREQLNSQLSYYHEVKRKSNSVVFSDDGLRVLAHHSRMLNDVDSFLAEEFSKKVDCYSCPCRCIVMIY